MTCRPAIEASPEAVALRRMRTLGHLLQSAGKAQSADECFVLAAASLGAGALDLPFALFYTFDEPFRSALLVAHAGLPPGGPAAAQQFELATSSAWPLTEALAAGAPIAIEDVQVRFPGLAAGQPSEPVQCAYVLPIHAGAPRASALVVAAVHPRLAMNEAYASFYALLGATLSSAVAQATAGEAERRRSAALEKTLAESADRLAEANKELEAFSYSVSHDLRAPLRAIDGFSRILLSDHARDLDEQGRRYLERIRSGTQRMAELIDDLLSLSRITRVTLSRERVDLTAISRDVLGALAAGEPDRRVESKVLEGLDGRGDARLIAVLLENLLGNAWKFTARQPLARIEFSSEERDGETIFFVRDNGAGFDMEYSKRLFNPFQRLHSASEFQGTGIGLATVHRVVTRHGGRVWAESAPGQGATFFFTLGEQS